MSADRTTEEETTLLNLFCTQEGDWWRVYTRAVRPPPFLRQCVDEHGEAFPVALDFDDLGDYMQSRQADYVKRTSNRGDIELIARGRAALDLAEWFASAFASGVRGQPVEAADPGLRVGRS